MISLRVMIRVIAMMLGLANVTKGFTVTIVQVNFQTCNWWFADENLIYYIFLNLLNLSLVTEGKGQWIVIFKFYLDSKNISKKFFPLILLSAKNSKI